MKEVKLITGTGSSGTTFLIELVASLGLTQLQGLYNESVKGGYEWIVNQCGPEKLYHTPPIFKDPRVYFGEFQSTVNALRAVNINLSFVWICYRNFEIASQSRIARGVVFHTYKTMRGVGATNHEKQVDFFRRGLEHSVEFCLKNDIDFMLVDYDRLNDWRYCEKVLRRAGYNLDPTEIEQAHKRSYVTEYKDRYKRLQKWEQNK